MTPSITQDGITAALGNFLTAILPAVVTVITGQANRVASPEGDYCVMWPLRRPRLATNVDSSADARFTGSIAALVMTVDAVQIGSVVPGRQLFGTNVAANTIIGAQATGPTGGAGTYAVSISQVVADGTLSAGATVIEQSTEVVYQVDVHGPAAGDNAQTISTAFRDEYGVSLFAGTGVSPLYCEDPRQLAFQTAAVQFEERWTVDVHMQVDPSIAVPTQYADAANVTLIDVVEAFPA